MREHRCPKNRHEEIYVLYNTPDGDWSSEGSWGDRWVLRVERIAHEQDVIDGEAEEIGRLMYSDEFIIEYCPFCGIDLKLSEP